MPLRYYKQYTGGGRVRPTKFYYNNGDDQAYSNTTPDWSGIDWGNFGPGGSRIAGQHTRSRRFGNRPGQQQVLSGDVSVSRGQKRDARLYSKNNDLAPGTEFESGGVIWTVNEGGGVTAVRQADTTPEPVVNDPTTTTEEGTTTTTTTEEGTTTTEEGTTTTEEGTTTTEEGTTTTTQAGFSWPSSPFSGQIVFHTGERRWYIYFPWAGWILRDSDTTSTTTSTTTEEGTTSTTSTTTSTTTEEGTTSTTTGTTPVGDTSTTTGTTPVGDPGDTSTTTRSPFNWPPNPSPGQRVFNTEDNRWYIWFPWSGWTSDEDGTTSTTSTTTSTTSTTSTTTGTTPVGDPTTTTGPTPEGDPGDTSTTEIEEIVVTGSPPNWSWPSIGQVLTGLGTIGGLGGFGGGGSNWTDYARNAFNAYNLLAGGGDPGGGGQGGSMLAAGGVSPIGGPGLTPMGGVAPGAMSGGLGSLNTGFGSPDAIAEALRDVNRSKIGLQNFPVFANEGGRIAELVNPENDRDTIPAMLTEDENVITRRAVLGLDLMNGGQGDFAKGHEILDNINKQGEDYLEAVLDRPLFNGGYYG